MTTEQTPDLEDSQWLWLDYGNPWVTLLEPWRAQPCLQPHPPSFDCPPPLKTSDSAAERKEGETRRPDTLKSLALEIHMENDLFSMCVCSGCALKRASIIYVKKVYFVELWLIFFQFFCIFGCLTALFRLQICRLCRHLSSYYECNAWIAVNKQPWACSSCPQVGSTAPTPEFGKSPKPASAGLLEPSLPSFPIQQTLKLDSGSAGERVSPPPGPWSFTTIQRLRCACGVEPFEPGERSLSASSIVRLTGMGSRAFAAVVQWHGISSPEVSNILFVKEG